MEAQKQRQRDVDNMNEDAALRFAEAGLPASAAERREIRLGIAAAQKESDGRIYDFLRQRP